jgi:hypothetical protein
MNLELKMLFVGAVAGCVVGFALGRQHDFGFKKQPSRLPATQGNFVPEVTKDLMLHTDNLFHTRVMLFLAIEAILFTALASVWSQGGKIRFVSTAFGLAFTIIAFLTNVNLGRKLAWIMNVYVEFPESEVYRAYRSIHTPWAPRSLFILSYLLPAATLLAWLLALFA